MKNTKLIALFVCLTLVVCSFAGCDVSSIPLVGDLFVKTAALEFNANGGELVGEAPMAYSDNAELALPEATLQYYAFLGWSLSEDGSNPMKKIPAKFELTEDQIANGIVLYAVYEQLVGEIEYNLDGGDWDGEEAPASYEYGSVVELPEPVKENFEFLGWTLNGEEFEGIVESTEGDLSLVASWEQVKTAITFNLGREDAKFDEEPEATFDTQDGLDLSSCVPSADGVEFAGWYLDAACTESIFEISEGTTEAVTVYAKWVTAPSIPGEWVPVQ